MENIVANIIKKVSIIKIGHICLNKNAQFGVDGEMFRAGGDMEKVALNETQFLVIAPT